MLLIESIDEVNRLVEATALYQKGIYCRPLVSWKPRLQGYSCFLGSFCVLQTSPHQLVKVKNAPVILNGRYNSLPILTDKLSPLYSLERLLLVKTF